MERKEYTITFLGDIMLGRLIDQLLPIHVDEPEEAEHVSHIRRYRSELKNYDASSPWGNTLDLLKHSDLVLGNLETSATTCNKKWPRKVFNYRMHPTNIKCLQVARIDYVSLANNHTLDFGRDGLFETVEVLEKAGIAYAGAGRDVTEAERPAILRLPNTSNPAIEDRQEHEIHLWSFSDHPSDWAQVPEFNLMNYTETDRARIKDILNQKHSKGGSKPSLKVVSFHWGPNYAWEPDGNIVSLAHFLVDECDVDIIHGHSSHHVQGVEIYKRKLIVYGCGDFVDDYAVVPEYRNDLSAVWNVSVRTTREGKLEVKTLEVFPNRIKQFRAGLIQQGDKDHDFVSERFRSLCAKFGTNVDATIGTGSQLIIDMIKNADQS